MADLRYLIVGLGNPGTTYLLTRHNVGFFLVEHLVREAGLGLESQKMQGLYWQGRAHGAQVLYLEPQTYMNRSGECVRRFVDYFKVSLDRLLIIHDDIDLVPGRIKIVGRGGAGGHNGIRSLIQHLGTQTFARMKVGIGRPGSSDSVHGQPVEKYVLAKFGQDELVLFEQRAALVKEAVDLFLQDGLEVCMNRINSKS